MDNNLKYIKMKLIRITYIDNLNRKLIGFIFANKYIKKNDRLNIVKKHLNKNAKSIVEFKKVDGFVPIDLEYINRIDIDYHI